MSFLRPTTNFAAPPPRLGNLDDTRINTNEEARILPYAFGRFRTGVTWHTPAYSPRADPIRVRVGKGSSQTVGYNYFASASGLVCHGPIDEITKIMVDLQVVWEGQIERGETQFAAITTDVGPCRFYWGTENQPVDDLVLEDRGHPAYAGRAYIVFDQLFFGRDRTTIPNVEINAARWPVIPWLGESRVQDDVNPLHVAVELANHPRIGLGLRVSDWDMPRMRALAEELAEMQIGISGIINTPRTEKELFGQIAEYFHGMIINRSRLRSFESAMSPVDWSATPVLEIADLTEFPSVEPGSFASVVAQVHINYTNRERGFKRDSAPFTAAGAWSLNGWAKPLVLRREWITRPDHARRHAAVEGRIRSLPLVRGVVHALKRRTDTLQPGDPFRLRPYPGADFLLNCRVYKKSIRTSDSREVSIDFRVDVTAFAQSAYSPPTFAPDPVQQFDADPLAAQRFIELPQPLADSSISMFPLAARPHALIIGMEAFRSADDTEYSSLDAVAAFAGSGTTTASITPSDTSLVLDMLPADLLTFSGQSTAAADADTLLLFLGDEIMSIEGYTVLTANQLQLTNLRRGRYDTVPRAHPSDAPAFIILSDRITALAHESFLPSTSIYFKAITNTALATQDLSTADAGLLEFRDRWRRPLLHSPVTINGDTTDPVFDDGEPVEFAWTIRTWSDAHHPAFDFYDAAELITEIDILDDSETVLRTITTSAGATNATYTASQRLTDFGSEPAQFHIRLRSRLDTLHSYFEHSETIVQT